VRTPLVVALLLAALWPVSGEASALRVAPISVNLLWPTSAATIKVRNEGEQPIDVQVRAFRWTQSDAREALLPTRDVVVSPPITRLMPGVEQVVRIVRVIKTPVLTEESYRLLVDELPSPERRSNGNVSVLLRYSVPVFVTNPEASPASMSWRLERRPGGLVLAGDNQGEQRMRIANLHISTPDGRIVPLRTGLLGYVLAQSTMRFVLDDRMPALRGEEFRLVGDGEGGAFYAAVGTDSRP
jgi:fimbrial chaperone protein